MRYLKRTKDYMLIYKHAQDLQQVGYSDSDFVAVRMKRSQQQVTSLSYQEVQYHGKVRNINQ